MNLDRNLGKTNPLNEKDLEDFVNLQKTFADSPNSWTLDVSKIDPETFDLSAKNPNKKDEVELRDPKSIVEEMKALDKESEDILNSKTLRFTLKANQQWESYINQLNEFIGVINSHLDNPVSQFLGSTRVLGAGNPGKSLIRD